MPRVRAQMEEYLEDIAQGQPESGYAESARTLMGAVGGGIHGPKPLMLGAGGDTNADEIEVHVKKLFELAVEAYKTLICFKSTDFTDLRPTVGAAVDELRCCCVFPAC